MPPLTRSFAVMSAMAPALLAQPPLTADLLAEADLPTLQAWMQEGRLTSQSLVKALQARIRRLEPRLRAVLELNPEALSQARAMDQERKAKGPKGPLHGIPVLLKDNLDTADGMQTCAGSLALVGAPRPKQDATLVARLRGAGAVILGKTALSEWANYRSTRSSSGWSGRGGQCNNPHALDRTPSGSSSGSAAAVAAGYAPLAIGTETNGSIVSPANACGIVGFKPTLGLWSRTGIIPLAASQDTAGPMTRTVRDAALVLGLLAGADGQDKATEGGRPERDYTRFLHTDGLKGARLGLVKGFLGQHPQVDPTLKAALDTLKAQGAEIVEVDLPSTASGDREVVLQYEFKAGLNAYLEGRGGPMASLADVIAFNTKHSARSMPWFGQELLLAAQARGPLTDPVYTEALARLRRITREEGIDKAVREHRLDALIAPTGNPAMTTDLLNTSPRGGGFGCSTWAAVAGYPHLTVPMGFTHGMPLNLSFFGPAWSEGTLLKLGYAFEQATRARRAPAFRRSLEL